MKIICVTGTASGVGKTTFIVKLLKHLNNWAVCKITPYHSLLHNSIKRNYKIEYKKEILAAKGKDTWKFLQSGARKVLWIKSKPKYMETAIKDALRKFKKCNGVIFEGNSALKVLNPDLSIMVYRKNSIIKKSARELMNKIDIFVRDLNDKSIINNILEVINNGRKKHRKN